MQARVSLSQDTETTLPELTEQQRTRQKEEDLSGLESVHMAESETECAAPGLDTLEPECVSAHGGVSDVHHTHSPLIKTENDLGSPHTGNLIKTESLDSAELQCMSSLHSDQIKTESVDGGYFKVEHISELQDIQYVNIKSDHIKYESSECLVGNVIIGAAVGHKDQTESGQCAGEPNQNIRNDEINLLTECEDLYHNYDPTNENTQHGNILQKSINGRKKHIDGKRTGDRNQRKINVSEMRYGCTWCEKCFSRKSALNSLKRIHTGEKPYKCTECEKCFTWAAPMRNKSSKNPNLHFFRKKTIHRSKSEMNTGEKPHACTHCGKCFSRKTSLIKHMMIHSGEKPHKCIHCGKCFTNKSTLINHTRIHTGEKPYKCTRCGTCFSYLSGLNDHMKIHSGEKPHRCTECGKCFSRKSILIKHMRIHTGEKPYKCTECEKCFSQTSSLNLHKRIHSGDKPYNCTECGVCFSQISALNNHMMIHSGEKPYKCTHCGKCFSRNSVLSRHMTIHSGE